MAFECYVAGHALTTCCAHVVLELHSRGCPTSENVTHVSMAEWHTNMLKGDTVLHVMSVLLCSCLVSLLALTISNVGSF